MMSQDFTTNLIDTFCSNCGDNDPRFLHNVWQGNRVCLFCTTCVLLRHKESFCPTCFVVYDDVLPDTVISCDKCHSYSHAACFSSSKARSPCSSCRDPNTLLFTLREVKGIGKDEFHMAIDLNAMRLLLAAAKIATISMNKAAMAVQKLAWRKEEEAAIAKKKAMDAMDRAMELTNKEKEYHNVGSEINNDVALSVDTWIHGKGEEVGMLQRCKGKGTGYEAQSSKVVLDIDLNEEYPTEDGAI